MIQKPSANEWKRIVSNLKITLSQWTSDLNEFCELLLEFKGTSFERDCEAAIAIKSNILEIEANLLQSKKYHQKFDNSQLRLIFNEMRNIWKLMEPLKEARIQPGFERFQNKLKLNVEKSDFLSVMKHFEQFDAFLKSQKYKVGNEKYFNVEGEKYIKYELFQSYVFSNFYCF